MALDGAFLHGLLDELRGALNDARIDKIHQPSREELILQLRNRTPEGGNTVKRLYLSCRAGAPRLHFTAVMPENPASPPMFCMLLRKKLTGGRLISIRQDGLERAAYLTFDCLSELGDHIDLTLCIEMMGRHSNIILIDPDGIIIDAAKRIDLTMSSVRPVLPGLRYERPPGASGMDLSLCSAQEVTEAVLNAPEAPLAKAILSVSHGLSPLLCREIAARTCGAAEGTNRSLSELQKGKLPLCIDKVRHAVLSGDGRVPYMVCGRDGVPLEYSFIPLIQYGLNAIGKPYDSFSELLDAYYAGRDLAERMKQRSHDILQTLVTACDRLSRKLQKQRNELRDCADRDQKRLYGDLITAHMHTVPRGADSLTAVNYYDPACAEIVIPLNPALSAAANAQKYYKDYRKAQTAEKILADQIAEGEESLAYLDTVLDALSRASTYAELSALREELAESGYLRKAPTKGKVKKIAVKPMTFRSSDGFTLLVGRNNLENDRLTLKTAARSDIWLHVKNSPGSHVIIVTDGQAPPPSTIEQAALLAAYHSKAAGSAQVPVDYTAVSHVKKPAGALPGRVIYDKQHTVYVTPTEAVVAALRTHD